MTGKDMIDFERELHSRSDISKLTQAKIGKLFVHKYVRVDFLTKSFREKLALLIFRFVPTKRNQIKLINSLFEEFGDSPSESNDLDELHKLVADRLVHIARDPSSEYAQLYTQAKADLKTIETRIKDYSDEIEAISSRARKGEIRPDDANYQKKHYHKMVEANRVARAEIDEFLKRKIGGFAISGCYSFSNTLLFAFRTPYGYAFNRQRYEVTSESKFAGKFRNMSVGTYRKFMKSHLNDEKAVIAFANDFIEKENILSSCRAMLPTSHIFLKRVTLLARVLNFYGTDDFAFCCLAIPQIEGLLHDYCRELGTSDFELAKMSVSDKAAVLETKELLHPIYKEYFDIFFPILRNKIAHGLNTEIEYSDAAPLILLDLHHVLELSEQTCFLHNLVNKTIERALKWKDIDHLVYFCLLMNVPIPTFYVPNPDRQLLTVEIAKPEFWIDLFSYASHSENIRTAKRAVIEIKKSGLCQTEAKEFLSKTSDVEPIRDPIEHVRTRVL